MRQFSVSFLYFKMHLEFVSKIRSICSRVQKETFFYCNNLEQVVVFFLSFPLMEGLNEIATNKT
jgi:hypothetical protein